MANRKKDDDTSPADIQEYLKGVDYPAAKEDLIEAARDNGAPREVLDTIQRLPGDRYEGPPGVMKAYGQIR